MTVELGKKKNIGGGGDQDPAVAAAQGNPMPPPPAPAQTAEVRDGIDEEERIALQMIEELLNRN